MTTLREQARQDAQACAHNDEYDAQYGADAASNLWEPEVERWRKHARNLVGAIDAMLVTGSFAPVHKEILDEVKEALSHDHP